MFVGAYIIMCVCDVCVCVCACGTVCSLFYIRAYDNKISQKKKLNVQFTVLCFVYIIDRTHDCFILSTRILSQTKRVVLLL